MVLAVLLSANAVAQESDSHDVNDHIQTVFKGGTQSITGYGAITNKFTYIGENLPTWWGPMVAFILTTNS